MESKEDGQKGKQRTNRAPWPKTDSSIGRGALDRVCSSKARAFFRRWGKHPLYTRKDIRYILILWGKTRSDNHSTYLAEGSQSCNEPNLPAANYPLRRGARV